MFLCFRCIATCSAGWVCVSIRVLPLTFIILVLALNIALYSFLVSSSRYCALFPGSHLFVHFSRYLVFFSIFLFSISVFVVLSIFTFRYSCFHFLLIFFVSISLMLMLYFLFILSMCCFHLLLLFYVCFISLFWSILFILM